MKTILYASDLGKGSRPAFRAAISQAKAHGARIVYLHVVEPLDDVAAEMINDYLPDSVNQSHLDQIYTDKVQRIQCRLVQFHDEELSESDVEKVKRPTIKVMKGKAAKCILAAIAELDVDLVVMGNRASSSLARLFLGSTAQKVIHQSPVPVLIVPLQNP